LYNHLKKKTLATKGYVVDFTGGGGGGRIFDDLMGFEWDMGCKLGCPFSFARY